MWCDRSICPPCSYSWLDNDTLVVCVIPEGLGPPPQKPGMPLGPKVQDNSTGKKTQNRTFTDLLKVGNGGLGTGHWGLVAGDWALCVVPTGRNGRSLERHVIELMLQPSDQKV